MRGELIVKSARQCQGFKPAKPPAFADENSAAAARKRKVGRRICRITGLTMRRRFNHNLRVP